MPTARKATLLEPCFAKSKTMVLRPRGRASTVTAEGLETIRSAMNFVRSA